MLAQLGAMLAHLEAMLAYAYAQSVVIYSILRCEMARTRVNTTVLVPESG